MRDAVETVTCVAAYSFTNLLYQTTFLFKYLDKPLRFMKLHINNDVINNDVKNETVV